MTWDCQEFRSSAARGSIAAQQPLSCMSDRRFRAAARISADSQSAVNWRSARTGGLLRQLTIRHDGFMDGRSRPLDACQAWRANTASQRNPLVVKEKPHRSLTITSGNVQRWGVCSDSTGTLLRQIKGGFHETDEASRSVDGFASRDGATRLAS